MYRERIIGRALKHVALQGADPQRAREAAERLWQSVLREPAGFQGPELARMVARELAGPQKRNQTTQKASTIMDQYRQAKESHPGMMLLFRIGDFYELFGEDADAAHKLLQLTLTRRGDKVMCGFPYHQLESYLPKLLRQGRSVAICDQVQDAGNVPIRREVTRVETPPEPAPEDSRRAHELSELVRLNARVDAIHAPRRLTLTDLIDPTVMIAWLNADGNPPKVVRSVRYKIGNKHGQRNEAVPVSDVGTLESWWKDYRSEKNAVPVQTHKQYVAECLRELGIKGGTIEERIARAKSDRPDIYQDNGKHFEVAAAAA